MKAQVENKRHQRPPKNHPKNDEQLEARLPGSRLAKVAQGTLLFAYLLSSRPDFTALAAETTLLQN